jgi:hypothetical protein
MDSGSLRCLQLAWSPTGLCCSLGGIPFRFNSLSANVFRCNVLDMNLHTDGM